MDKKDNLSADQQIGDIINRYDFQQDEDLCRRDKNGGWIRRYIVLSNKKKQSKRRYVCWRLVDGLDEWKVSLASPAPPRECEGVQRKERIYVAAALRFIQEQLLKNRCKAPNGSVIHGQCQRCGGDLICEMRHKLGIGYTSRLVCFGRQGGDCEYADESR